MSTAPPPAPEATPAAPAAPLCAACRVPLQRGFMLDLGYNDQARAAEWVEGAPQPSFWRGLQLDGRLRLPVQSWRCPACGLLAQYAPTPPAEAR